ncbi:MAG: hypothetical protein WDZ93_00615 [Candidatus Paceibacterota bacterium]
MRFQAVTQIILVILSIVIILTIIRPMFVGISEEQDEVQRYREAVDLADQFNARLGELAQRANAFSAQELQALDTYLPSEIDPILVSRDLVAIADRNGLLVEEIAVEDDLEGGDTTASDQYALEETLMVQHTLEEEAEAAVTRHQFTIEAAGTYGQMKQMLRDVERNHYPLRLSQFEFKSDNQSSLLSFTATFETYVLNFDQL